jgi:hypothetical protein
MRRTALLVGALALAGSACAKNPQGSPNTTPAPQTAGGAAPAAGAGNMQQSNDPARRPSPLDSTRLRMGRDTVKVVYSRPRMNGRRIFGGLVPYDSVWRTGANEATTLRTSAALQIGSVRLDPGTYTLYTIPKEQSGAARCMGGPNAAVNPSDRFAGNTATPWTLIISRQTGQWGTTYEPNQDLARLPMLACALIDPVEKFEIRLNQTGLNTAQLIFSWEMMQTWVDFRVLRQ